MNESMEANATVCVPKNVAFLLNCYLNKEASTDCSAEKFYDTSTPKYLLLISRKAAYNDFMYKINEEYLPVYTIRRQKGSLAKIFKNTEKKRFKEGQAGF